MKKAIYIRSNSGSEGPSAQPLPINFKIVIRKIKKQYLCTAAGVLMLLMTVLQACRKGEMFSPSAPAVVEVSFAGSTTVPLEFIYNNLVVDSTRGPLHGLPAPFKLNVTGGDQKVAVREKGKTAILKTYDIQKGSFKQEFGIFYDNGKIYDAGVIYNLQILSKKDGLDFYLDGKLIHQNLYPGATLHELKVPIEKDQKRELTVRKSGEEAVLVSRMITIADDSAALKFYFDGERLTESMKLPALKNPQGMLLTFQLFPDVEFGQTAFLGGDVDIVFYTRDQITEEVENLQPELRVTVPAGQQFASVELPPLPDGKLYTCDVLKRGTHEIAYQSTVPGYTARPGLGKHGVLLFSTSDIVYFLPGQKVVCTITAYEELGGTNFDEIYITPFVTGFLDNFVDIVE
ncbi:hypothetical protein HF329_12615 [Chitinophaga oryzae]|uniref:Uncharacterized protein n=1 Tax=Chitinophaga oryzae TaxID=2725414 RepID=A0AAE6ZH73_9BACT|nr:hypothetical protein [Chitinophaga oryzae]QJB32122.1 hypothetical protein HF329_12615 [Chitinophaga oryzae]